MRIRKCQLKSFLIYVIPSFLGSLGTGLTPIDLMFKYSELVSKNQDLEKENSDLKTSTPKKIENCGDISNFIVKKRRMQSPITLLRSGSEWPFDQA